MYTAFSRRAAVWFVLAAVFVLPAVATDQPNNHQRRAKPTGQFKPVPVGSIKIPLPDIQQPDDYWCGAAALMSICS